MTRKQTPEHIAARTAKLRGRKRTEEQRQRIAEATREAMTRPETQKKLRQPRPGAAAAKTGARNPMYGKPVSEETRRKRAATMGDKQTGERNPAFKAAEAKPSAIHIWINRRFEKSGVCELCGEAKRTEWAFLRWPASYTRERGDYAEMCRSCHMRHDFGTGERTNRR